MSSPFTDFPDLAPTVVFPRPAMQAFSAVVFMSGVSILSYITSRRSLSLNPFSPTSWRAYSWPRLVCLMVFITSWFFLFTSGVLVLGVGMSSSAMSCGMGIVSCIVFYVSSKIFIYLFLIEKVYVVSGTTLPRLQSKMYLLCAFSIALYLVIIILMVLGRIAELREDGACLIGLKRYASVALLGYDLFLNVFLTGLFVYPILRSKFINKRLRTVAIKTMLSALMALTTSTVNMLVLTLMHGKQLGFVCLASCGADVTINAIVLFYVTWSPGQNEDHLSGPSSAHKSSRERASKKAAAAPRNDYSEFPAPPRTPEVSFAVAQEVTSPGGTPRPPSNVVLAREFAFNQAPGVRRGSSRDGGRLFPTIKNAVRKLGEGRRGREERDVGMNSISIHVVTEVTGEDAEGLDMSPMDRLGRDDASAHFDTSNRSYHRDGQQITPPLTTPTLSHVISDSDDGYDDESVSKSSFSNSKTALR